MTMRFDPQSFLALLDAQDYNNQPEIDFIRDKVSAQVDSSATLDRELTMLDLILAEHKYSRPVAAAFAGHPTSQVGHLTVYHLRCAETDFYGKKYEPIWIPADPMDVAPPPLFLQR